jgi:hypothetical protein
MDTVLNNTCSQYRHNTGRDAAGGLTTSRVAMTSGIRCRIQDATADQRLMYGSRQMEVSHIVFTKFAGFKNGHDILDENGKWYRLLDVKKRRQAGSIPTFYVIGAIEIELPVGGT